MQRSPGPTETYRVVQVHPVMTCNLRCAHCYSQSGPDRRQELPLPRLCFGLNALREEGFHAVGVSGGEPLLYKHLSDLLLHARQLGMITTVTTNGMLITPSLAEMLLERATLVAVSLDGAPESHNRLRGSGAFEKMSQGVNLLKRAGVPFGYIFTLTLHNLNELDWVAAHAVSDGARLLQVHPLETVGRAAAKLPHSAPDDWELARGFVEVARLQQLYKQQITIQYDVADVELLRAEPIRAFAGQCECTEAESAKLAELIAPVIVQGDGSLVPLQYNFQKEYQIGSIMCDRLPEEIFKWKRDLFPKFLALCQHVHRNLTARDRSALPFVNWYSEILQESSNSEHVASSSPATTPVLN